MIGQEQLLLQHQECDQVIWIIQQIESSSDFMIQCDHCKSTSQLEVAKLSWWPPPPHTKFTLSLHMYATVLYSLSLLWIPKVNLGNTLPSLYSNRATTSLFYPACQRPPVHRPLSNHQL